MSSKPYTSVKIVLPFWSTAFYIAVYAEFIKNELASKAFMSHIRHYGVLF